MPSAIPLLSSKENELLERSRCSNSLLSIKHSDITFTHSSLSLSCPMLFQLRSSTFNVWFFFKPSNILLPPCPFIWFQCKYSSLNSLFSYNNSYTLSPIPLVKKFLEILSFRKVLLSKRLSKIIVMLRSPSLLSSILSSSSQQSLLFKHLLKCSLPSLPILLFLISITLPLFII